MSEQKGSGPPAHLRLMLARFRAGCEVCGVMEWSVMAGGGFHCGNCGNVFDVPVIDPGFVPETPAGGGKPE